MSVQHSLLRTPKRARTSMTRRTFMGATLGAAAIPLLQACGGSSPADGNVTIEMWVWETEAQWKQVAEKAGLAEKFPNVTFKWTALPYDQLHQKALTALGAGLPQGLPSIIRTGMPYYRTFANTGSIVDLTDQVRSYQSDIFPAVWDGALIDEKIYQVPDDTGVMLLGYRKDLMEQAGLPVEPDQVAEAIMNYDDLITVGNTLQEKVGAGLFNELPGAVFNNLILQDSTGYFDKDGNVIFDSDYHIEVATISKKIWDSGLTTHYEQAPQQWQAYKDGKLALLFYPNWQDFVVQDNAPDLKGKWAVTRLPMVQEGGRRATAADGVCLTIPSSIPDEQKQVAIEVAKFLKLTEAATVAHMETFSGAFVSYIPGINAMSETLSPILDNQKTYELFQSASIDEDILPWYRTSIFFSNATEAVENALFKILNQNAPIPATLKEAADSIRSLQDSRGTK